MHVSNPTAIDITHSGYKQNIQFAFRSTHNIHYRCRVNAQYILHVNVLNAVELHVKDIRAIDINVEGIQTIYIICLGY